jgi:hypothetical protein
MMWKIAVLAAASWIGAPEAATTALQPSGLKIVVIEGEGAVNIIQQRTAVAPLVEVRDRNNQPVAGAIVTFTIDAGKNAAVAGGAQTVTVTTNAAGRAAMTALNPVNSGSFQIQVQAAFQGQTAAATIAQTNVMTAAQAANAAAAGAGGGGGGVSGLAIAGIAGGVGVAGAVLAAGAAGGGDSPGGTTGTTIDPAVAAAAGTYTLQQIDGSSLPALTILSPPNPCPGFTDSATMTLTVSPQSFDFSERSHIECRSGPGNSFNAGAVGNWSLQGGTITFTSPGGNQFNFGPGTLNGSTLTFAFDAPHANTGNPALRVNSVWRK